MAKSDKINPVSVRVDKNALQKELNSLQNALNKKPLRYQLDVSTVTFMGQIKKMSTDISRNLKKAIDVDSSSLILGVRQYQNMTMAAGDIRAELEKLNVLQNAFGNSGAVSGQSNQFRNLSLEIENANEKLEQLQAHMASSLKDTSFTFTLDGNGADIGSLMKELKKGLESLGKEPKSIWGDLGDVFSSIVDDDLNDALSSGSTSIISAITGAFQRNPGNLLAAAIPLALEGITWLLDKAIVTLDEQKQKVEECSSAYEDAKSQVENVNSKLVEQGKLLDELQNKKNPTLADQNEIDKLQKMNTELRIQADLAERAEAAAQKELAVESAKLVSKHYIRKEITAEDVEEEYNFASNKDSIYFLQTSSNTAGYLADHQILSELTDETSDKYSLENQEYYRELLQETETYLNERLTDLTTQKANMQGTYDDIKNLAAEKMTDGERAVFDSYQRSADEIKLIYEKIRPEEWNQMQFDGALDTTGLEKSKEELIAMAKEGTLDKQTIESYEMLNEAISSSDAIMLNGKDTVTLFLEEIYALAEEEKKLAELQTHIQPAISYEEISKASDEYTSAVNSILSSMSLLDSAMAEQNENGSLSAETVMKLTEAGYASVLQFDSTTNAFHLNTDAIKELTEARINENIQEQQKLKSDILERLNAETSAAYSLAQGYLTVSASSAQSELAADSYNKAQTQIKVLEQLKNNLNNNQFGDEKKKKVTSSGGSDPTKEAFSKDLNSLKHNLEMDYITQKEYYDSLEVLNNKYFKDKPKYLDDYRKNQEELYKGLRDYYKEQAEDTMDLLEKQLDAGSVSYQHYSSSVSSMLDSMYAKGQISAADYHKYVGDMLNRQLSVYNSVLSAVTKRFDREIDGYQKLIDGVEKQNEALENKKENYDKVLNVIERVYDKEIESLTAQQDVIQEKIDSLNEEADAYDLVYRKEQAIYELNRSMNQRTKKVYTADKGYIYTTDRQAVKDAEKNLEDIKNEELIGLLEKEQETLQESIDTLEQWKNKWSEISDTYSMAQDELLAKEMLGAEYQNLILQNNITSLEDFKNNYVAIEQQINDNTSLIESYNEKIEYYEGLKAQWNAITDAYETEMENQYAANVLGQNWEAEVLSGRTEKLNEFKAAYINIQQALADAAWKSANEQIKAAKEAEKAAAGAAGNAGSVNSSAGSSDTPKDPPSYHVVHVTNNHEYKGGFKTEDDAYNWIAEQEEKRRYPTSIIRSFTVKRYRNGGALSSTMPGLDYLAKQQGEDHISAIAWKDGEGIVTKEQTALLHNLLNTISIPQSNYFQNIKTPVGLTHSNYLLKNGTAEVTNHVTVTLPNVTNNGGYQNFTRFLTRFQLDTMQYANRR